MTHLTKNTYPSHDDALETIRRLGGIQPAGVHYGVSPSSFRSWLKREGIWKKAQEVRDAAVSTDSQLPGVPDKPLPGDEISKEEKLEQRVKELEARARKDRKDEVLNQRIVDALEIGIQQAQVRYSPRAIPKSKHSSYKHEFALLWSDLHAGETVSLEETNGINEYDWRIMLDRHDAMREAIFSYQDNRPYPVERLHVWGLGDMLSGNIHQELAETNEIPMAEATVELGMDGGEFIASLNDRFKFIDVAGIVGNHPRAHQKPQAKRAFDNGDWIAYHTMRLRLRGYDNISFTIPKSAMAPVEVAENWRALLLHGDGIRSTMPGVPWGGVMRRVNAIQNQYTQIGQPIDLFALGHFHTLNLVESNAGLIAMNGSVKGVDEYSVKQFGGGRGPQQMLLTWHPKKGLVDMSRIDLDPKLR